MDFSSYTQFSQHEQQRQRLVQSFKPRRETFISDQESDRGPNKKARGVYGGDKTSTQYAGSNNGWRRDVGSSRQSSFDNAITKEAERIRQQNIEDEQKKRVTEKMTRYPYGSLIMVDVPATVVNKSQREKSHEERVNDYLFYNYGIKN